MSGKGTAVILLSLLLAIGISIEGNAQPITDRQEWVPHAYDYAELYWEQDGYNRDYGYWPGADCAHFTSQLANAGCLGLAEINALMYWDTNGSIQPNNVQDCANWDFEDTCPRNTAAGYDMPEGGIAVNYTGGFPIPGEFDHTVISLAYHFIWWIYYCGDECNDNTVYLGSQYNSQGDLPDDPVTGFDVGSFIGVQWADSGEYHMYWVHDKIGDDTYHLSAHTTHHGPGEDDPWTWDEVWPALIDAPYYGGYTIYQPPLDMSAAGDCGCD